MSLAPGPGAERLASVDGLIDRQRVTAQVTTICKVRDAMSRDAGTNGDKEDAQPSGVDRFLAGEVHPEDLTHEEVHEIVVSPHVRAEQLNLLAAHARHVNAQRLAEVKELDARLARINARLAELAAANSAGTGASE